MLLFGVSASNSAPLGSNMLVKYAYGCSRFSFPLETWMYYLLLIIRAVSILLFFFPAFFFGVAQAFMRRFCSGICYFSVFLLPIMLHFGGQICFKEAIMLVKYATLW